MFRHAFSAPREGWGGGHFRASLYLWALLIIVGALCAGHAKAHSFYPWECCAGYDCAPVKAERVKEGEGGFTFTILPGEHPMAKDWKEARQFFIPYREARPSPDGEYHLCIVAGEAKCAWAPMGAS